MHPARRIAAALVAVTVSGTLISGCSSTSAPDRPTPRHTQLQAAAFGQVVRPAKPPRARFTRHIYASVKLAGASVMLDACHGPIAVDLGPRHPVLVAQHDYCGGSAWMPRLNQGEAVRLTGDGVVPGTYVVTEIRYQIRNEATVGDLPATDIVLQTCISEHEVVLVGMDLVGGSSVV